MQSILNMNLTPEDRANPKYSRAMESIGKLEAELVDNEKWMREVLADFRIPFDDHKVGRRLAFTQWMCDHQPVGRIQMTTDDRANLRRLLERLRIEQRDGEDVFTGRVVNGEPETRRLRSSIAREADELVPLIERILEESK